MNVIYENLFGTTSNEYPEKLTVLPDYAGGFTFSDNGSVIGRITESEFNTQILSGDNEVIANVTDGMFGASNINFSSGDTFYGISDIDNIESWVNPLDGNTFHLSKGIDGNWNFSESFGDIDIDLTDNMLGGFDITSNGAELDDLLSSMDHLDGMDSIFEGVEFLGSATESVEQMGALDYVFDFVDWSDF